MKIEKPWLKYNLRFFARDVVSFICYVFLKIAGLLMKERRRGVRVLVYHSIKNVEKIKDPLRITVPPELFESQIDYLLSSGYKILPIGNILDYIYGVKPITGKEVILTFDDGFDDSFKVAYNILKKNGITATYFLTYDYIASNLQEISRLTSMDISIGSHTLSHVNLRDIRYDTKRLYDEIATSKKILEDKLNTAVRYFAYPFGSKNSYDRMTETIVKKSGYKAAFTNIFGSNKKGDNIFELKRIRITWDDNLFRFRMKLEGAYDWIDRLPSLYRKKSEEKQCLKTRT